MSYIHAGTELACLHSTICIAENEKKNPNLPPIRICRINVFPVKIFCISYTNIRVLRAWWNLLGYQNLPLATTTSWFTKKTEIVNIAIKLKCLSKKDTCRTVHICQIEISVKLRYPSNWDTSQTEIPFKLRYLSKWDSSQTEKVGKKKYLSNWYTVPVKLWYLSTWYIYMSTCYIYGTEISENWDICQHGISMELRYLSNRYLSAWVICKPE